MNTDNAHFELLQDLHTGVVVHDPDTRIVFCNQRATELLGFHADDVMGKTAHDPQWQFVDAQGQALPTAQYPVMQVLRSGSVLEEVVLGIQAARSPEINWVLVSASPHHHADGSLRHVVVNFYSIQQRKKIEAELHAMLDNDLIGILKVRHRVIEWNNRAASRLLGYEPTALRGQPSRVLYADEAQYEAFSHEAYTLLEQGQTVRKQMGLRRQDGSNAWFDVSGVMLSAAEGTCMWLLADISQLKQYQAKIEQLAFHDSLTKLPNRLLLADRLQQALALATRNNTHLVLCYLDLDGFKPVNDTHGHEAGDVLLQEIGQRLQASVRPSDTVCRIGGDEFVLLLTQLDSADDYRSILERSLDAIRQPVALNLFTTVQINASVGIARFPQEGQDADTLLRHADRAMYQSKRNGRGQTTLYTPDEVELPSNPA